MRTTFLAIVALAIFAPTTALAQAVATFDDDPSNDFWVSAGGAPDPDGGVNRIIPKGYAGVSWSGFRVLGPNYTSPDLFYTWATDTSIQTFNAPLYDYGVASSLFGGDIFSDALFDLDGAYAASNYLNGMTLNVWGFRGGTAAYFRSFTIDVEGPSLLTFGFRGVDRVRFETVGGCASPGLHEYGQAWGLPDGYFPPLGYCRPPGESSYYGAFALDNVRIGVAPEPATVVLLASGLLGLAVVARRRARPWEEKHPVDGSPET